MLDDSNERTLLGKFQEQDDQTPLADEIRSGEKLDKFEIIRQLGKGGMGAVYLARDPTLDRQVAIKVLSAKFSRDESALKRFLAEARAAGRLSHPNVVGVYEVVQRASGEYFIVMEYVANGSVAERTNARTPSDPAWAATVVLAAAQGLAAAHHIGLTHRDIKPANLMIGENEVIKVADFGLARSQQVEDSRLTQDGQILGTPYFMSPEQCVGREVDARSDLYSLGATFYTLLAGSSPFEDTGSMMEVIVAHVNRPTPNLRTIRPGTPGVCVRIIERAMAKQPEDRYQTAEEMIGDLEAALVILKDTSARATVTYRGTNTNKLDSFVLPSEKGGGTATKVKSSLITRLTGRASTKAESNPATYSSQARSASATVPEKQHDAQSAAAASPLQVLDAEAAPKAIEAPMPQAAPVRTRTVKPTDHSEVREDVFTVEAGCVVFAWPASVTSEEVEDVRRWLDLVMEKMRRKANEKPGRGEYKSGPGPKARDGR